MPRENDASSIYDDYTGDASYSSQVADHELRRKIGSYLPFDRATYYDLRVPCQALAMLYYVTGVSFHVVSANDIKWSVTKKQIASLMENGKYVWVASGNAEAIDLSSMMSVEVVCAEAINRYRPKFQEQLDAGGLSQIIGSMAHSVVLKGRKRYYYADGRTGASMNVSRPPPVVRPDTDATKAQEQVGKSDAIWDAAQARARGY